MCLNDKHTWCSLYLSAQLLWWQPGFWSVFGRKSHWAIFMELIEKKSDILWCFFSFFSSHLDRKAHLTSFSVIFFFINEAFSLRLIPCITLTSINIHKYIFKLFSTTILFYRNSVFVLGLCTMFCRKCCYNVPELSESFPLRPLKAVWSVMILHPQVVLFGRYNFTFH